MPLSEETFGGTSLPPTVTLTVKEATMRKIKLIVHECFAGKQNSKWRDGGANPKATHQAGKDGQADS